MPSPGLELNLRARPAPKPLKPPKKPSQDVPLELAVDPRQLVAQRAAEAYGGPVSQARGPASSPGGPEARSLGAAAMSAPVVRNVPMAGLRAAPLADGTDIGADARVLADFGEVPVSWVMAPAYAWRVLKRQRELKTSLAARRVEAEHAATVLEDALVAFAERTRPAAEKLPAYAVALEELQRAEDVLRSRDKVLAAEQDAQKARLAQVDARLAKLEEEQTQAHTEERMTAQELSSAQGALEREEAKLKRAEAELRAAQKTDASGAGG
jgi:hypothetical protein